MKQIKLLKKLGVNSVIVRKDLNILHNTFGFNEYLANQEQIILAITRDNKDVLAIMPTGSGKSLCYQLPSLMLEGLTIVVSPLISLMKDQLNSLTQIGLLAKSLNSSNSYNENMEIISLIKQNKLKILYISPEKLLQPQTLDLLNSINISFVAIDEAHCISQWGNNFREDYKNLGKIRSELGTGFPILALTATADNRTEKDIIDKLNLIDPLIIHGGYYRSNLHLSFKPKNNAKLQILNFINKYRGSNGIIYCSTRKKTEAMAEYLIKNGYKNVLPYHAGLNVIERNKAHELFSNEDDSIITATTAFGMGIDKPNVRFVCHMDMPSNIESYYQEIGRAGRDGLPAYTLTIFGMDDIILRTQQIIDQTNSEKEIKTLEHQRLSALRSLCDAIRCRWQVLLNYFNETIDECENCDVCNGEIGELVDGTKDAQKILSAISRTGQVFGINHIVDVLLGIETQKIMKHNHNKLPTFGVVEDQSKQNLKSTIRQLWSGGYISVELEKYGALKITTSGNELLYGRINFLKRKEDKKPIKNKTDDSDDSENKLKGPSIPPNGRDPDGINDSLLDDSDDLETKAIRKDLKVYRTEKASEEKVPPYVVFQDITIIELSNLKPRLELDLYKINGLGKVRVEKYGKNIIDLINKNSPLKN